MFLDLASEKPTATYIAECELQEPPFRPKFGKKKVDKFLFENRVTRLGECLLWAVFWKLHKKHKFSVYYFSTVLIIY
jgi:hypothetical protein